MGHLATLLLTVVVAQFAAQPPAQDQTQPFRTGVQAVEVDVRVIAKNGQFVTDLTPDDFQLSEDGVPQRILSAGTGYFGTISTSTRSTSSTPSTSTPSTIRTLSTFSTFCLGLRLRHDPSHPWHRSSARATPSSSSLRTGSTTVTSAESSLTAGWRTTG